MDLVFQDQPGFNAQQNTILVLTGYTEADPLKFSSALFQTLDELSI